MTLSEVNPACRIKKTRRKRADMAAVKDAIVSVLKADHPMTVRQVFYQLVVRDVVKKTEMEYQETVCRLLTDMRMDGEIPFAWISDESRQRTTLRSFDSLSDALKDTARFYRRSALRESDVYIEIWSEKQALAGIMSDEALEYGVDVVVSKGMPSLTQLYQTASLIRRADRYGKPTYIYQFGDHDPSGVLIPQTIERRLKELCEKLDSPPPYFERVALTLEQIDEFNLPTRPTKRDGNSHAHKFEGNSVELDALPSAELRRLVRECIQRHITPEQYRALEVAERSERDLLRIISDNVRDEDAVERVRELFEGDE